MSNTQLLSKTAVAYLLDTSEKSVDEWSKDGRLPAPIVIGNTKRWRQSDLDAFLESHREASK